MFDLHALGRRIAVRCDDPAVLQAVGFQYAALSLTADHVSRDLELSIRRQPDGGFVLHGFGAEPCVAEDVEDVLFRVDEAIVVNLQRLRPHLVFVHAGVLERAGLAWMVVGASGAGKSTTCWGLLQQGLGFRSDELAPIDLSTLRVHAFPRALCLKRDPPDGVPLPADAARFGRGIHVPVTARAAAATDDALPLGGVVHVAYEAGRPPALRPLHSSEGVTRLYAQLLNALAHPHRGLDAALTVARAVPAVALDAGDLRQSCRLVVDWIDRVVDGRGA